MSTIIIAEPVQQEPLHDLPYGRGLRNPDAFLRWIATGVIAQFDGLVGCQLSDLIQEGRIGMWRGELSWARKGCAIGERGYVTYMMVSACRRMGAYLERMVHQLRVPPGCPRPKRSPLGIVNIDADDGGMEAAKQSMWIAEQLGLVEAVLLDLWPEHGACDFQVFASWVSQETRTLSDVVSACDWLKDERAGQAVLERVIQALREYFGGNVAAPIILGGLGNRGGSRGTRKSRADIADYQADYYQRNAERLRARNREQQRQRRAPARAEQEQTEGAQV